MHLIAILVLCLALFGGYQLLDKATTSHQNVEAQGIPAGYVDCGDGTLRRSCDVQPRQAVRVSSEQESRSESSTTSRSQTDDADDTASRQRDETDGATNCTAKHRNYLGDSATVTVAPGHLVIADFYSHGQPIHDTTILPEGTWIPDDGILVGSTWDYPNCPYEAVERQAEANPAAGVKSPSDGFSEG